MMSFCALITQLEMQFVAFEDNQKKALILIGEDGMYTNLALLLSDQCRHTIKLAFSEGDKKTILKIAGSLAVHCFINGKKHTSL